MFMVIRVVTDSELLMLCHEQNEEAFKMLINRYQSIIKVIANKYQRSVKYLGTTDDELYNEGIKAIINAIDYYNEDSGFMFRTYVNKAIDSNIKHLLKKYYNINNNILNDAILLNHSYYEKGVVLEDYVRDLNNNLEDDIVNNETLLESLETFKNILTKREYRILLMLKDGYKCKDIANKMETSIKNVYNTIYRIRNKLKEIIKKKY